MSIGVKVCLHAPCAGTCNMCPSVYLVVGAVLLLALAALQQVGGGATGFGHLVLPDGLLGENVPQLFQLVAGHFLHEDNVSREQGEQCEVKWL